MTGSWVLRLNSSLCAGTIVSAAHSGNVDWVCDCSVLCNEQRRKLCCKASVLPVGVHLHITSMQMSGLLMPTVCNESEASLS